MAKRIFGVVMMALSVIGIIICLAFIVGAWAINTPTTEAVVGLLTASEQTVEVVDNALERADLALSNVQSGIDDIEQRAEAARDRLAEVNVVGTVVSNTLDIQIAPAIATLQETVLAVQDTVAAFNETIDSLNRIPGVNIEQPELQRINSLVTTMQETADAVQAVRTAAQERREERADAIVTAITTRTEAVSQRLATMTATVAENRAQLAQISDGLANLKAKFPGWVDLFSILITLIMIWLVVAQVYAFAAGRDLFSARGDDKGMEALPEPEPEPKAEPGPQLEPLPKPEPEPQPESEPEPKSEPEPEPEPEPEAEPEAEPEPEPEPETELEPETAPEPESESKSEAQD